MAEPASPPCYAHKTDAAYSGYLTRDEVMAVLADTHRYLSWHGDDTQQLKIEKVIERFGGVAPQTPGPDRGRTERGRLRTLLPRIADDDVFRMVQRAVAKD